MRSYARSRTPCRRGELTSTSEAAVGGSGVGDDEDKVLSLAWGAADSLGAGDCVAASAVENGWSENGSHGEEFAAQLGSPRRGVLAQRHVPEDAAVVGRGEVAVSNPDPRGVDNRRRHP